MRRFSEKRSGKLSRKIYDEAYWLQMGEYYPQHHQANVQRLRDRYPDYAAEEVDRIYRQACRLEPEIEQWMGGMRLSPGSRQELLEWLEDHFYGFTKASFSEAIERVEGRQT